ncbi:MAG: mycofactocin biosynthesis chaperone MftB [Deltaproteobacteria bacterium]|nr:mycofactocin biosynthesis chaperone MftB [Deltaproteobacteria bacterium]
MDSKRRYRLKSGVQVRKEAFGLLFYDYRGPRLYFVPTKNLIEADFFNGKQTAEGLINKIVIRQHQPRKASRQWVMGVLAQLEQKGLVHG